MAAQFFGALLGVVITAIITVLLLQGQTQSEESKEKNLKVFLKKQEVFFEFLSKINEILQKESLALHLNGNKKQEQEITNLQDLLFEFGFLQMHTSDGTFEKVMNYVANLIEERNKIKFQQNKSKEALEEYYEVLSDDFFSIVALLKKELYNVYAPESGKEGFKRISREFFARNYFL